MNNRKPTDDCPFYYLESHSGLRFEWNQNASVRRIMHGSIMLNLWTGNELEGSQCQIHLRRHEADRILSIPLLGPQSPARFACTDNGWFGYGDWQGIVFEFHFVLPLTAKAWFWHIRLRNADTVPVRVDLIHTQDTGLADYGAIRLNEYYVSQYVDFTPLEDERHGRVLAVRQNQPMEGGHPWLLLGSLGKASGFATDALQYQGLMARAGGQPVALARDTLPNQRLQHEHALAVLAEDILTLQSGETTDRGFYGCYLPDHPEASSIADLARINEVLSLPEAQIPLTPPIEIKRKAVTTLFNPVRLLPCQDLTEAELIRLFGGDWHLIEREQEELLSFFTDNQTHIVLKAKELRVLRPHGHILRTGASLLPDEAALTSTVWMNGVFNSMLTQGHVSINRFLSTTRSYLSLFRSHGQRIFVDVNGEFRLLDIPSAFDMKPNACRWFYRWNDGLIVVSTTAGWQDHVIDLTVEVMEGEPRRLLICQEVALNGDDGATPLPVRFTWEGSRIRFNTQPDTELGQRFPEGGFCMEARSGTVIEAVERDERLFADGQSRRLPYVTLRVAPAQRVEFRITGQLIEVDSGLEKQGDSAEQFWQERTGSVTGIRDAQAAQPVAAVQAILPWFAHNALIHFLAPRGLEQFSGGGWGVRDVTQGPVEMLLAEGCLPPVRDLLVRVFSNQNPDGDWPQWFMFFEREQNIRPGDSHGDIVFWPLLATARYLLASADAGLLKQTVPFYHPQGSDQAERGTVWQHIERAFALIAQRRIPDTHLAAYGHGDWNDSLQPVDPDMRERLCSTWTVTLHHQTLTTLALAFKRLGMDDEALRLNIEARAIYEDFRRYLLVDGVLTGFAHFHAKDTIDYLVHPRDDQTGLNLSLLPMIHAILTGLLTPTEAEAHLALIDQHLKGPDGARLFDRPSPYRGGLQRYFQRAESAAYFGREIGLMYTHAHLRYAEALALTGRSRAFFEALCQAIPIQLRERTPSAALRQSNCYYSSSDAAFSDRYEALAEYASIMRGDVTLEGGWRIYSSGAGIACRLIRECWLGLRREHDRLIIDPVIPKELDGMKWELMWEEKPLNLVYQIGDHGHGPKRLLLNGEELPFTRQANPYRTGGAVVLLDTFRAKMQTTGNELVIVLE